MSSLDLIFEIGRWSMNALWLPMLVWTAVALPVFAIQRWSPGVSSHTRYWTTLGLTASLPIGLMASAIVAVDSAAIRDVAAVVALPGLTVTTQGSSAGATFSWTTWHSAGALTIVACMLAVLRTTALVVATCEVRRFHVAAMDTLPALVTDAAARLTNQFRITREIRIVLSDTQSSPLTFGWRAPVVVLPRHLLTSPNDLRLSLAHEFVHIRRGDYLWQWCEHLIGALFFVHPLVAVLRNEASILREITCDADVLAYVRDRSRYARLLYHYSTGHESPGKLAVGILLRENHLKTRISAMKNLLDFKRLTRTKRTALAVSIPLLVVAVVAVACSDVLVESSSNNSNPALTQTETDERSGDVYVVVEQMPELVGGLASLQENLRYPKIAKDAGVSGRVIVQFVVDEKGTVVDPQIIRGIGSGLDEAAIEAVGQAKFKPGLQRGEPVRVKMSLPITFKLASETTSGVPTHESDDLTTLQVDDLPEIVGGLQAIQQDLRYTKLAKQAGIEGRVIVEFVVTKTGTAEDVRIVRGVGAGLDEEAVRVVRNAQFRPAQKDGEPVAMKLTLPITFKLM